MNSLRKRYCIFGCDSLRTQGVPLHRFPNPEKYPDLFAAWVSSVGDKLSESDPMKIYRNKRVCDHHFELTFKETKSRLKFSAIPTVHLNRVQQSVITVVEMDHNYDAPKRNSRRFLADITNLPGPSAVEPTVLPLPSGSTSITNPTKRRQDTARSSQKKFDAGVQQSVNTTMEIDHSFETPKRDSRPSAEPTVLPVTSGSTSFTCQTIGRQDTARSSQKKFDAGVQQSVNTIMEIDHSFETPERDSRPSAEPTVLPVPSGSTSFTCQTIGRQDTARSSLKKFDAGVQQSVNTIMEIDHSFETPKRDSRPSAEPTVLPVPSGSTSFTSPTIGRQDTARSSLKKFDAEKTFEYLQKKQSAHCARKVRKMENEIRRLRQKAKLYQMRLRQVDKASVKNIFFKLTRYMSEPATLFTRMQVMEGQKKKKGHRFTLEEKTLSLSLFKKSPKAYKLMCKLFTLPSPKVLKSLLAQIKLTPGINELIFKELKTTVSKMLPQDRLCTLIFDEMSLSPHINYNVYTDDLVGFENYGDGGKTNKFANHVLVFMIKGIKNNYKQPVAYYFTQALKAPKLKEIIVDVVKNVHSTGLNIIATVCDQSSANVSAIHSLISDAKNSFIKARKEWRNDVISINNHNIIPLFDVPHLLKGIRNNLLNKEMEYINENKIKTVKWEYFQRVYEADKSHGELRILPKLTNEHMDPTKIKKMRVKNAAQVLSHSMAVAVDNLAARGDIPSECCDIIPFVLLMDKLFDTFNSSSFSAPNGKIYRAAVKRNSPHHQLWQDALKTLKSVKFMVSKSDKEKIVKSVPTVNNLIKTIEGFKSLWQLLLNKYSLDAMMTRNFNQDPLENFFGSIRSLGARNVAPNCVGFEGAFKTLLLNNFSSSHAINSNCEEDTNYCLQSLAFFINNKEHCPAPSNPQSIVIDQPLNIMDNARNVSDLGADQRIYVCGWALTRCLQKVVKGCKNCKSKLLGNSDNELYYKYLRKKEYYTNKKLLCYPSDCLIVCFREIQEITIAFLNSECYKIKIKERIKAFIDLFIDFKFLNCNYHKEKFKNCFVDYCINIIIYSWCRSVNKILEGKMSYEGEDLIKKAAQIYYFKHKV